MVLARLPDAPPGTKGLSLFLIPKYFVNDDGSLGQRNDVTCAKLEHKLGIHGSPTAVLNYGDHGGATGWLVGGPSQWLARDVHHDDRSAPRRRRSRRGHRRARFPASAQLCARAQARRDGKHRSGSVRRHYRASGCEADAAYDEGQDERGARDLLCDLVAMDIAHHSPDETERKAR